MKKHHASDIQKDAMELIKSILSQLGVNGTFLIQITLVLFSYIFLSKFLFKPLLNILVTRFSKVDGLKKAAEGSLLEYDRLSKDYKMQWKDYETKAKEQSDQLVSNARSKAQELVNVAEQEAAEYLKTNRGYIKNDANELLNDLRASSKDIQKSIKTKLLGA